MMIKPVIGMTVLVMSGWGVSAVWADQAARDELAAQLAKEVRNKGWIIFSARAENGSWDVFLSRPDGSQRRNITRTANFEEVGARFSPDSKKILYRRLARGTTVQGGSGWGPSTSERSPGELRSGLCLYIPRSPQLARV